MTYYNAIEAIDLSTRARLEMIQCKNPQIISVEEGDDLLFVDKKSEISMVMKYNENLK